MKKFIAWTLATLVLAAFLHVAGVWYLPRFLTRTTINAIFKRSNITYNQLNYGNMRGAPGDIVPMENPDSKTSLAAYDVTEKPVRLKCVVPDTGGYWSVSLFAWNTDNFYVVNDQNAKAKVFDLVLVKPDSKYQKIGNEEVIVVPTNKGAILIRMLVKDKNNKEELDRLTQFQKQTVMETIETAAY